MPLGSGAPFPGLSLIEINIKPDQVDSVIVRVFGDGAGNLEVPFGFATTTVTNVPAAALEIVTALKIHGRGFRVYGSGVEPREEILFSALHVI